MTNLTNPTGARAGTRKQNTDQAIQLAIQGRWEDAERLNRHMIGNYPDDVDAHNRLGKALTELGRYDEARAAYERAVALDPSNSIARKNLARLAALSKEAPAPAAPTEKVDPHLFVEETGKTGVTNLVRPVAETLARMTAGDRVYLRRENKSLVVDNSRGETLGTIESRMALRLIKLMDGGNEYAAAIASIDGRTARVIIKETFQHPSQAGKLSFPTTGGKETVRPYTRESLVRHEREDEEPAETETEDADVSEDWDGEGQEREIPLYTHLQRTEGDEKDDEYEE